MDRNSAIGLTLIAALLLVYFYWFSPKPEDAPIQQQVPAEIMPPVTEEKTIQALPESNDSLLTVAYGDLSSFITGSESVTAIETKDLKIAFSNRGGVIKELELKNYKTYYKEPLKLIEPGYTRFELLTAFNGKPLDLYKLYYEVNRQKKGDSTVVNFKIALADGSFFEQEYTIPEEGYEIRYSLNSKGLENQLNTENLNLQWNQIIKPTEKDLSETRNNTTINFYTDSDGFDELSQRSTDTEKETLATPVKWIAVKQKFFLSSLIAKHQFNSGEVEVTTNVADTSIVKVANVKLSISRNDLTTGKADYKFFLGPNNYKIIGGVAEKFSKNVYLGFPPVYWVNKYVIFPVFHFLTRHISNFGLVIVILVILLKLALAPLSYRSYLSMAKMKVLKPELDEIKEKNGEDMSKVQQEQLKLYQQVGVNPISGCVPVLLQMPILFAMFYLFPASIELRQQPLLWADDLSTYDSIIRFSFSIPFMGSHISLFTLLMTASTLIYTWQNNQISSVTGPMKSMSYMMPIVFFFVLNSFSAGLTFYYFVSNLVTFAQQAIIRKFVNEDKIKKILEENRKKNLGGGKKSKFMAKLEEAMKASQEAKKSTEENKETRRKKRK